MVSSTFFSWYWRWTYVIHVTRSKYNQLDTLAVNFCLQAFLLVLNRFHAKIRSSLWRWNERCIFQRWVAAFWAFLSLLNRCDTRGGGEEYRGFASSSSHLARVLIITEMPFRQQCLLLSCDWWSDFKSSITKNMPGPPEYASSTSFSWFAWWWMPWTRSSPWKTDSGSLCVNRGFNRDDHVV